jgi:hypothetical protein
MAATFVLTGLRLSREEAAKAFQGVRGMRESTTYQLILDEGRGEGRLEGARRMLLRFGGSLFGPPTPTEEAAIAAIADVGRLERMADQVRSAGSWQELLSTP